MPEYNPTRPAWDTSTPGEPSTLADREDHKKEMTQQEVILAMSPEERLNYFDSIQSEAVSLANSPGAAFMVPEQALIAGWTTTARVAAACLTTFRDPGRIVEYREERIREQERILATSLYRLGQIDSALSVAAPYPDLVAHIQWIAAAIDHEDDLTHDCPRPTGTIEIAGKGEVEVELDRRYDAEMVFSARHGRVVHVWVCSVCNEANATVEAPERQARQTRSLHKAIDRIFKTPEEGETLAPFQNMLIKKNEENQP